MADEDNQNRKRKRSESPLQDVERVDVDQPVELPAEEEAPPVEVKETPTAEELPPLGDALEEARWIYDITDPALKVKEIHEAFMKVIFQGGVPNEEESEEEAPKRRRFRTAAEDEGKKEAREDLADLMATAQDNPEEEEDSDIFDFDKITEQEEEDRVEEAEDDDEFVRWVGKEARRDAHMQKKVLNKEEMDIRLELLGMGETNRKIISDPIPERFREIDLAYNQKHLLPRPLQVDGKEIRYEISQRQEAIWILQHMCKPFQPLSHNVSLCVEIGRHSPNKWEDQIQSVVDAIANVLETVHREFLEPSHLIIYRQTMLMPLLDVLWSREKLDEYELSKISPSFAYCTKTGRRQKVLKEGNGTYVGFAAETSMKSSIGNGDSFWQNIEGIPVQRKSCVIELGRLLWHILELDVLCHTLESRRQVLLEKFRTFTQVDSIYTFDFELLQQTVFEDPFHVVAWDQYATYIGKIMDAHSRADGSSINSAYANVVKLGWESQYAEYALRGTQFHRNLFQGTPHDTCQKKHTGYRFVADWAENFATPQKSAAAIQRLLNQAALEQLCSLPLLRQRVFDAFCAEGYCNIYYANGKPPECIRLAQLFPVAFEYFELIRKASAKTLRIELRLDISHVEDILCFGELFSGIADDDDWSKCRQEIKEPLIRQLIMTTAVHVDAALRREATAKMTANAQENLGRMCAEGPYEPTFLNMEAFQSVLPTWDASWNAVEALPDITNTVKGTVEPGKARICGCFRGETKVTVFAFTDASGILKRVVRWIAPSGKDAQARELAERQRHELYQACVLLSPNVIAVSAHSPESTDLFKEMKFFVAEFIMPRIYVNIPVIWAPTSVPLVFSWTAKARAEKADTALQTALSLARYIQNPLFEICRLFTKPNKDILRLPLGLSSLSEEFLQDPQLYRALEREMSLWIAACGVDVNHVISFDQPHLILQFLPGLGYHRAQALSIQIKDAGGLVRSRQDFVDFLKLDVVDYTANNVLPSVRIMKVAADEIDFKTNAWMLERTLIPPAWYVVAGKIAQKVTPLPIAAHRPLLALTDLMSRSDEERYNLLNSKTATNVYVLYDSYESIIQPLRDEDAEKWRTFGWREVQFIIDELVNFGRSFMRRPYRKMSSKRLLKCTYGVDWMEGFVDGGKNDDSLTMKEGDVVECFPLSCVSMPYAGVKLQTSRGIPAFIAAEDITDESIKEGFYKYIRENETVGETARVRGLPPELPWMSNGVACVVHGIIQRLNLQRVELRLKYCPAPEPHFDHFSSVPYERSIIPDLYSNVSEGGLTMATIRTAQITKASHATVSKLASHVLYRHINGKMAEELLKDKLIGEFLFRPQTGDKYGQQFNITLKAGYTNCVVNIGLRENRIASGEFRYAIQDRKVQDLSWQFDDPDHCHDAYIRPYVQKIESIRNHPKFCPSFDRINDALEEQYQTKPNYNGLVYVFSEADPTKVKKDPYVLFFRIRRHGELYSLKLHLSPDYIYLHDIQDQKYHPCQTIEEVCNALKIMISRNARGLHGTAYDRV